MSDTVNKKLELIIDAPTNDAVFVGSGDATSVAVDFKGHTANAPSGVTLYYKWYSSLYLAPDANHVPLNASDSTGKPLQPPNYTAIQCQQLLGVGSHTITFTASDQEADTQKALANIKVSAMAGGPPPAAKSPCVIHVLVAQPVWPTPAQQVLHLNRSDGSVIGMTDTTGASVSGLQAAAPIKWNRLKVVKQTGKDDTYVPELDPDYQAINRISYVWIFTPVGAPVSTEKVILRPKPEDLKFLASDKDQKFPRLAYRARLPDQLVANTQYQVSLRVEDSKDASKRHTASKTQIFIIDA